MLTLRDEHGTRRKTWTVLQFGSVTSKPLKSNSRLLWLLYVAGQQVLLADAGQVGLRRVIIVNNQ